MACYRFNPPYKNNVTTRMGQTFLHFADIKKKKHILYKKKTFYTNNKYTINKGWSCMHNIKTVINNHTMNIHYQNNTRSDEKLLSFKSEIFIT